mmetsp:Transcript_26852/g.45577  ORF Transcript_26852/g.45577 Transcript_26852/m.45577 type:complete len:292 (-) Transcript_26852:247-1122(-)
MSKLCDADADCHRTFLEDLVHREQRKAYQKEDFLSRRWQQDLWEDVASVEKIRFASKSPSSVIPSAPEAPPFDLCVDWREKICEWKYKVVDCFDLDREVVSISMFFLDKYLEKHFVNEELFQLAAMACIYLATKIHCPKKISMKQIVSLGSDGFTTNHLEAMELSVADTLGWHLHPPTSMRFIENFFPLIMCDVSDEFGVASALELSRFLTELSVCVYQFTSSNSKPSSVAIAAILLSISHFQLPHTIEDKFRELAASLSLELNSPEISKCGKLLSVIYACHISHDPTPFR